MAVWKLKGKNAYEWQRRLCGIENSFTFYVWICNGFIFYSTRFCTIAHL